MALSSTLFPTLGIFNATFIQPSPPLVATELSGVFVQHKWSTSLSHIVSGFWYNSATHSRVRIDETYDGGISGSSIFDYADMNAEGGVKNHQILVGPSVNGQKQCFEDYVANPAFPLITGDLLVGMNASFGGVVRDSLVGETVTWNFLFADMIPVTVYLDDQTPPVVQGFDFWGTEERTKVVTRFFAHKSGEIGKEVFEDFECKAEGKAGKTRGVRDGL